MTYNEVRTYICDICLKSVNPPNIENESQMPIGWSWLTIGTKIASQTKINKRMHLCKECILELEIEIADLQNKYRK